jgi:signal transduction histidine kinase
VTWDDGLLIGLAAMLGLGFSLDAYSTEPSQTVHPVADLTIGALACAALLLRHRWPVALAVVLTPAIFLGTSTMGATPVALLAVALYRPWPYAAGLLMAHAGLIAFLFGLVSGTSRDFWQGLLAVVALDVALVVSGLLVRSQRRLVVSLRERERLRMEDARHAERERIAGEMHDVLAHRISLVAVHAGALEVRRSASEDERQAAAVIRQAAYDALEDLREVLGLLRAEPGDSAGPAGVTPADDRPQPTLADLATLVEQSRQAGTDVALEDSRTGSATVQGTVARHAYRLVQEGLTNARKHAPELPVRVRLSGSAPTGEAGGAPGLHIEIINTVPAATVASPIPGAGSGLIGLRERVRLAGGRLEHGPTPDGHFRLYAWLPWRP